jgi:hypothetical protein
MNPWGTSTVADAGTRYQSEGSIPGSVLEACWRYELRRADAMDERDGADRGARGDLRVACGAPLRVEEGRFLEDVIRAGRGGELSWGKGH